MGESNITFPVLYLVSSEDVAEIVQEVFIKLWETRHLVDEEQPFEGFLFIVTRNQIFNYSRKQLNYSFLKMTVLQSIEQSYEDEDQLEISDLKKQSFHTDIPITGAPAANIPYEPRTTFDV